MSNAAVAVAPRDEVLDPDRPRIIDIHIPAHDDWLTREELDAMTPEKLIENVRALKPMIAAHALEAERTRRPVDAVWNALRKTGAMYHFVPKRYGGLEYDLETFINYIMIIGEACASTAWAFGQCVEHIWGFSLYPQKAQDEMYEKFPYICCPGLGSPVGEARVVPGGWKISGCWQWGSGGMNADWIKVSVIEKLPDGSKGRLLQVIFPAEEATCYETWIADGMCGTGSNDIGVEDLFVPEHRALDFAGWFAGNSVGSAIHDNPIYRLPMISFLSLTTMIPAVGAAKNALEHFIEYQKQRTGWYTENRKIEGAASQMRIAKATIMIETAEMLLRDTGQKMMDVVYNEKFKEFEPRARIRLQNNYAMELCRKAVQIILEGAGARVHLMTNPIQRALRDINVMAGHTLYDWDSSTEMYGRAVLGYEPNSPIW